ncbi:MAG: hypothetical protein FJX76_17805 [Armatimonadetes bacterium]|nr:hypothetical protein [Armatimonadota bacterium]
MKSHDLKGRYDVTTLSGIRSPYAQMSAPRREMAVLQPPAMPQDSAEISAAAAPETDPAPTWRSALASAFLAAGALSGIVGNAAMAAGMPSQMVIASVPTRLEEALPTDGLLQGADGLTSWIAVPEGASSVRINAPQTGNDGSIVALDGHGRILAVMESNWDGALWGPHAPRLEDRAIHIPLVAGTERLEFDRLSDEAVMLDGENRDLGRMPLATNLGAPTS